MAELIQKQDTLNEGRVKINAAITDAEQAKVTADEADSKATQALANSENTQTQLNTIVINGDSSVEAAQARVDEKGVGHTTLKDRIDDGFTKVTSQLNDTANKVGQGSYVDKMLDIIKIKGLYAKRFNVDGGIDVVALLDNDEQSAIKYQFRYNLDGLLLLRGVFAGVQEPKTQDVTLNGSFNSTSAPTVFTTTIGDYIDFTFTGTGFDFEGQVEPRGGYFDFVLEDGRTQKITCYSETNARRKRNVFSNLPFGTYKCKAIFRGDDPDNPPTSSPSRGYIYYQESNASRRPISVHNNSLEIRNTNQEELVSQSSIPDFAISARPAGTALSRQWVPVHSGVSGVSKNITAKIIIDGITRGQTKEYPLDNDYFDIDSFELIQSFGAYHTDDSTLLWQHYVSHRISKDNPYLSISNRVEIKSNVDIGDLYLTMLPVNSQKTTRLVLNNGDEFEPVPIDGSSIDFDDVSSAMFSGEYKTGYYFGTAVDVLSYTEAIGARLSDSHDVGVITFRTDDLAKFYLRAFKGIASDGDVFQNTQRISCISGVRFPNTMLKLI